MAVKFSHVIIHVADVPKSLQWYGRVFGLATRTLNEAQVYGELETGSVTLVFSADELERTNYADYQPNTLNDRPAGVHISLQVEDVAATYARALAEGGVGLLEPVVKPWGLTVAWVRDLNGFTVALVSPS